MDALLEGLDEVLSAMARHPLLGDKVLAWAQEFMVHQYKREVADLSLKSAGSHFQANSMSEENLREYEIKDAVKKTAVRAPMIWSLLKVLMSAEDSVVAQREKMMWRRQKRIHMQVAAVAEVSSLMEQDIEMDFEMGHDNRGGDEDEEGAEESDDEPEDAVDHLRTKHEHLMDIVSNHTLA